MLIFLNYIYEHLDEHLDSHLDEHRSRTNNYDGIVTNKAFVIRLSAQLHVYSGNFYTCTNIFVNHFSEIFAAYI